MSQLSQIRQNFHQEVEGAVNKQVNIELYASYVYLSMACYFERDDIALHNAAAFFRKQSDEEREHAMELMKFQNLRGGRVVLQAIQKPEKDEWGTLLEAMQASLALEKFNNECLLNLHGKASEHNDVHMCDYLEGKFLGEQVESINEIGKMVSNLKRCGDGLGEYLFDKHHFSK